MKVKPFLLGSCITLALVFMLVIGCVGGLAVAPYVQQQIGTFRHITSAPVSSVSPRSNFAPTPAPAVKVAPLPTPTTIPLPADASPDEKVASDVYRKVSPSVVYIQVEQGSSSSTGRTPRSQTPSIPGLPNQPPSGVQVASGSGFVLDKEGHILTNNHVVDGATKVEVSFIDGTTVHATVVGTDPSSDLAVVQVDVKSSLLQPVELGDSTALVVGEQVYALGNPFGLDWTLTSGIVSAVGRTIQSGTSNYSIPEVVQTDAAINPGNSGGPLLDRNGRVIGVNAQIVSQSNSSSGVGFAIPVSIVKRVVPALIKDGHYNYAWLGISGASLTLDLNEAMNLSADQRGVLVQDVTQSGPADKAGAQVGQSQATVTGRQVATGGDVIIAVDGQPVTGMDDVIDYLFNNKQPGDKMTLTVLRNGQQKDIQLTLGERPKQ